MFVLLSSEKSHGRQAGKESPGAPETLHLVTVSADAHTVGAPGTSCGQGPVTVNLHSRKMKKKGERVGATAALFPKPFSRPVYT